MMNQLLMQMLTARSGGVANPALLELLAQMNSPAGSSGGPNLEELLAQQATTNPMAAMLAKHLAEQRARAASEEARVIDVEATHETEELPKGDGKAGEEVAAAALEELREKMTGLLAEIEVLQQRNDTFAAAVGACCLCWGQKIDCRSCRGRGGPGFCIPDESLFEEFVLPAVRTLRAQRAKGAGSSPQAQARTASA